MGIAGWGWDRNWVRQGRVTAGSEVAGLGVGNLQNDHGSASMGWQTVGKASWLLIDALDVVMWRALLLARTNLTATATVRWRVGNDPTFGTWSFDSGFALGPPRGIGQVLTVLPAAASATAGRPLTVTSEDGDVLQTEAAEDLVIEVGVLGRYARCDIADPANPDGFLNVALAYAGPLTQTRLNIGWGGGLGRTQGGSDTRTRGGATFPRLDWAARTRDIEHNSIVEEEVWPFVMDLDLYARRGGNVLFVPDPDSPNVVRETIFGRLTPTAMVTFPNQTEERCAWRATIEERL